MALNYRREIDGLRAVAVLAVILHHAGFDMFSGGFVGVDVFFVIDNDWISEVVVYLPVKPCGMVFWGSDLGNESLTCDGGRSS